MSLHLPVICRCAAVLLIAIGAGAQDFSPPLLRFQQSQASLETVSAAPHAQGYWGVTFGNPGDVSHYPNSLSCLVVYKDGKYILEKTQEKSVGRPKTKRAEGKLSEQDLQQLNAILSDGGFQKIVTLRMPDPPDYAVAVREIESVSAEVNREGSIQQFSMTKERFKTNRMSGMDEWLDNVGDNQKLVSPLMKWFKDAEKNMKSGMQEAKPQYCRPISIG